MQYGFWDQESVAMCGHKSLGRARSWLYKDTSVSPPCTAPTSTTVRGYRGLLLLGMALPGASQSPLKFRRQAQSTCWGPLGD